MFLYRMPQWVVHLSLAAVTLITPMGVFGSDTVYQLDPIRATGGTTGFSNATRKDLDPTSIVNPNKVESSSQAGVEVFTQKDIQNLAPKDMNDLLSKATGVELLYHGRKNPYFINIRGGGSVTYIIDGAVLPSTANKLLHKIPMNAIAEVQIVRGSSSLTLGPSINVGPSSSGSGLNVGYIIIKTKQPEKTEAILAGSLEKAEGHPYAYKESLYLGTRYDQEDSSFYVGGIFAGSNKPSEDTWFDGQSAESKMANAGFSYGKLSGKILAYQDTGRHEFQRGVTVTGEIDNSKWYYDPMTTQIVNADMTVEWSENHATLVSLFGTRYEHTEFSNEKFGGTTPAETIGKPKPYWEETKGVSLRHNIYYGDTTVMLGAQSIDNEGFGANNSENLDFKVNVSGWAGSIEEKLFDGAMTLDAGYRQDQKHIDHSSLSTVNQDVDMPPAKIYAFGGRWNITPTYVLSARYFNGDQGANGDFEIRDKNNNPLHAEKQKRIEASLEANYDEAFMPMLTWFSVETKNEKSQDTSGTPIAVNGELVYPYKESDTTRKGLELLLRGYFSTKTSYKASWTHLLTYDSISNGVTTDNLGSANPKDLYTLTITQEWDKYRANLSIQKESGWHTSTSKFGVAYNVDLGDFTRVDANIMREFKTPFTTTTLTLYARNLTDEKYATRYSAGYYYDRGRVLGLDVSIKY